MAYRFPAAGESEEHLTGGAFVQDNNKHSDGHMLPETVTLDHAAFVKSQQHSLISIFSGDADADEIAEDTVTHELANVLVAPTNSMICEAAVIEMTGVEKSVLTILVAPVNSDPVAGNSGNSGTNIEREGQNVTTCEKVMKGIEETIKAVGTLTVAAAGGMTFDKPASGVVFIDYKLAYRISHTAFFVLGVAELFTGLWISMYGHSPTSAVYGLGELLYSSPCVYSLAYTWVCVGQGGGERR